MRRLLENQLIRWKSLNKNTPILLRGARQVGKSHLIEQFGNEYFDSVLTIDFELQPEAILCFQSLHPTDIVNALQIQTGHRILPGKTLLFLDEIQVCPRAIHALRYFKEKMPELHVIAAGSLLEFVLKKEEFRMPVGRVHYLYLKPMSFFEFLGAKGAEPLLESLQSATMEHPPPLVTHHAGLLAVREYMSIGGMPEVVDTFVHQQDLVECQIIQTSLLKTYRDDFGKYAHSAQYQHLHTLFPRIPGLVAQWFKYNKAVPGLDPRTIRSSLELLSDAGLITSIYATAAAGIPLITHINPKKFKLLFIDVGLLGRTSRISLEALLQDDLMLVNRGVIVEQYVGQELLTLSDSQEPGNLYFWVREKVGSSAEVDYVINLEGNIIPIEVKAGGTGRLRSLKIFMEEKKCPVGVHISTNPLGYRNGILSCPLYMIGELPRLLKEL